MGEREEGEGVKDVESEKERLIGIVTEKRKIRQTKTYTHKTDTEKIYIKKGRKHTKKENGRE